MSYRFSLLFYFKKPKRHTRKELPIYLRISVGNQRMEISTQRKWDPDRWNPDAGRAMGTKEDARALNNHLETFQFKLHEVHRQLISEKEQVTIANIKAKLEGRQIDSKSLLEIFREHNKRVAQLLNKDFAPGTLERYETALSHTASFIKWKYKKEDIDIQELSYEFVTDLEFWLKSVRNCSHNTSVKYISNLKKIIHLCLKNGWLLRDPFLGYKMNKREVVREILTKEEIVQISSKTFPTNRLSVIRDIFLFSCYTGLAYADVRKLKRHEIATGIDGDKWIFTQRTKTETPSKIPLLQKALQILEVYKDHPSCNVSGNLLPVPSNQKVNAYLSEIADLCGIRKKMTFHMARHTFATTITLANGVPIETVGKMLGHRNLKTTQHYAKILDKKVSDDMLMLKSKLDVKTETAISVELGDSR